MIADDAKAHRRMLLAALAEMPSDRCRLLILMTRQQSPDLELRDRLLDELRATPTFRACCPEADRSPPQELVDQAAAPLTRVWRRNRRPQPETDADLCAPTRRESPGP
jgi:hypothetical protein